MIKLDKTRDLSNWILSGLCRALVGVPQTLEREGESRVIPDGGTRHWYEVRFARTYIDIGYR